MCVSAVVAGLGALSAAASYSGAQKQAKAAREAARQVGSGEEVRVVDDTNACERKLLSCHDVEVRFGSWITCAEHLSAHRPD